MRLSYYDIGDVADLRTAFTSRPLTDTERATLFSAGTLPVGVGVTPVTVTCTVELPDGTSETPSVDEVTTGIYSASFEITQAGPHAYAFDGEGAYQASGERKFQVRARQVPR